MYFHFFLRQDPEPGEDDDDDDKKKKGDKKGGDKGKDGKKADPAAAPGTSAAGMLTIRNVVCCVNWQIRKLVKIVIRKANPKEKVSIIILAR